MKQNNMGRLAVKFSVAAIAAMVVGGCETDGSSMKDFFPNQDGSRPTQNFMNAQAAAGARADATLQPMHFDGGKLNSLGEAKLDLILKDDQDAESMVVYMNLNEKDEDLKSRRDAVSAYLEDHGVAKDGIEFKMGSSPKMTSLAIDRMQVTPTAGGAPSGAAAGGTQAK